MVERRIKFGTDGWRGIIADDFTFGNVRLCTQALADYLKQHGARHESVVVGYDTRFASEDFASAAAEVLAGNGIRVHLCSKAAPTPVVSFAVPTTGSAGGIVITASHNPAAWSGLKYKTGDGASAPGEITSEIEANVTRLIASPTKGRTHEAECVNTMALERALKKGLVGYLDPSPPYFDRLGDFVDLDGLRREKLKVLVDPMYGAGSGYFTALLDSGGIQVTEINSERNPSFPGINPEPIARHLTELSRMVVAEKADVGLATDGDADRIGIVDENGRFLTQHQVFALLCLYLLEVRGQRGAIVKALTATTMTDRLGELFGVPVLETPVGFKYVASLMLRENALIGGEESGGYGFRGHIPERDAFLAGLYFLDFMVKSGKTPSQLLEYLYGKVGPHHYDRSDFHIAPSRRQALLSRLESGAPETIAGARVTGSDTVDGFRYLLGSDSWLLIRFSGTEPLVRVYSEAESLDRARQLLQAGRELLGL